MSNIKIDNVKLDDNTQYVNLVVEYIAGYHYESGETEIFTFEGFQKELLTLIDYQLTLLDDDKQIRYLKKYKISIVNTTSLRELSNLYTHKEQDQEFELFDFIEYNISPVYEIKTTITPELKRQK